MAHEIYLVFASTLKDDGKWTSNNEVNEPAGYQHSELLFAGLPEEIKLVKNRGTRKTIFPLATMAPISVQTVAKSIEDFLRSDSRLSSVRRCSRGKLE